MAAGGSFDEIRNYLSGWWNLEGFDPETYPSWWNALNSYYDTNYGTDQNTKLERFDQLAKDPRKYFSMNQDLGPSSLEWNMPWEKLTGGVTVPPGPATDKDAEELEKTLRFNNNRSIRANPFDYGTEEWEKWERFNTNMTDVSTPEFEKALEAAERAKRENHVSSVYADKLQEEWERKNDDIPNETKYYDYKKDLPPMVNGPVETGDEKDILDQQRRDNIASQHNRGAAKYTQAVSTKNAYQKYQDWLRNLDYARNLNKEWEGMGGSREIWESLKGNLSGQMAAGQWQMNKPERRPDEGVSGTAGDFKYSGVSQGNAARLEAQVGLQEAQVSPGNAARESMFAALQDRVNKQLDLQAVQGQQSREMALRKMIFEKQNNELKLSHMKDQIDTQYMNSLISAVGGTFANAINAWGQYSNQQAWKKQASTGWAQNQLDNSVANYNYKAW